MIPTKIHRYPCKHCPTAHYPPDEENEQIKEWVRSGEMKIEEAIFPCAWRPWKLCKGQNDYIRNKKEAICASVDYGR